ncbi:MAG: hypothetical protein ACJ768_19490, partial [Gaiellaceae bacterium]
MSRSEIPTDQELTEGLEQAVAEGHAEHAGTDAAGNPQYRLTEAGRRHVEEQLLPRVRSQPRTFDEVLDVVNGRPPHDDVSLVDRQRDSGRAAITERGRIALELPEERFLSANVTIYPAEQGCGLEHVGDPAGLTWLEREDALALARGILAHLEPTALVPRRFSLAAMPADASRAELLLAARALVAEERRATPKGGGGHRLERFAHGLLERLNASLSGLGFRP